MFGREENGLRAWWKAEPMAKVLVLARWSVEFGACMIASAELWQIDYTGASTVIINMKNIYTAKETHCESKQILICVY